MAFSSGAMPSTTRRGRTLLGLHVTPGARVSWSAVFAGLVIATAAQLLLALLGLAIGLTSADSGRAVGTIAALWTVVSALASLWIGARWAAQLANVVERGDGAIHGLLVWGLSILLGAYLLTHGLAMLAGGVARLAEPLLTGTVTGAAQVGAAAVENPRVARTAAERADSIRRAVEAQAGQSIDSLRQRVAAVAGTTRRAAVSASWLALIALGLTAAIAAWAGASAAPRTAADVR